MPLSPTEASPPANYQTVAEFKDAYQQDGPTVLGGSSTVIVRGQHFDVDFIDAKVVAQDADQTRGTAAPALKTSSRLQTLRKVLGKSKQNIEKRVNRIVFPAPANSAAALAMEYATSWSGAPGADLSQVSSLRVQSMPDLFHTPLTTLGDVIGALGNPNAHNRSLTEAVLEHRLGEILRDNLQVNDTVQLEALCWLLPTDKFAALRNMMKEQLCDFEAEHHVNTMLTSSSSTASRDSDKTMVADALLQHRVFQDGGGGIFVSDKADYIKASLTLQIGSQPARDLLCRILECPSNHLQVSPEELESIYAADKNILTIRDGVKGADGAKVVRTPEEIREAYNKANDMVKDAMKVMDPIKVKHLEDLEMVVATISQKIEEKLWNKLEQSDRHILRNSIAKLRANMQVREWTHKIEGFKGLRQKMADVQKKYFDATVTGQQSLELLSDGNYNELLNDLIFLNQLEPGVDLSSVLISERQLMRFARAEALATALKQKIESITKTRTEELEELSSSTGRAQEELITDCLKVVDAIRDLAIPYTRTTR